MLANVNTIISPYPDWGKFERLILVILRIFRYFDGAQLSGKIRVPETGKNRREKIGTKNSLTGNADELWGNRSGTKGRV